MGRKKVRRRRREGNKGEAGLHERKRKKVAPGKMGRLEEARGLSGGLRRGIYDVISSLTVNNFPGGCGRHGGGSRVRLCLLSCPPSLTTHPPLPPTEEDTSFRAFRGLLPPPFFSLFFSPAEQIEKPAMPRRPRDTVSRRPKSNIAQME